MLGRGHDVGYCTRGIAFDGQRRQPQLVADVAGREGGQLFGQRCAQRPRGVRRQLGPGAVGVERMGRIDHRIAIDRDRTGGFGQFDGILAGECRQVVAAQWFSQRQTVQHRLHG